MNFPVYIDVHSRYLKHIDVGTSVDSSHTNLKLEKLSEKARAAYPCQRRLHQMSSAFEISLASWILPWVKYSQVW